MFRQAWHDRDQHSAPRLRDYEAEFLPAALAVEARPLSPVAKWVSRCLVLLVLTLAAWSILGHVDIIVDGDGKLIASGYTKAIASVEVARVKALYVEEGQQVSAGQVLIALDTRETESQRTKAGSDRQMAMLQVERARALLRALNSGGTPHMAKPNGVDAALWHDAEANLADQWRDYLARRERLQADALHYGEELPLAQTRVHDYANLVTTGDVSRHDALQAQQMALELARERDNARNELQSLTTQMRKDAEDVLTDAERIRSDSSEDEQMARVHSDLLTLTSPVAGTIQQLKVHTIGGVVPAADPLMEIVPAKGPIEMEASIANRDVGFVHEGQSASVKIDAYDYTRYGFVPAHVVHVSRDAIQDDKRGLIYAVKVRLDRDYVTVDGRRMPLTPGMSGHADIKTGTRRIIDYVLSPIIDVAHESLREH